MHVEVAPDQPALVALAVDSLGKDRLSINPLRPPAKAEKTYELRHLGNAFEYRPSGASPAAPPAWVFEFSARQMHLRLHFAGGNPPPPLMLNLNSYFYHATLLGLINVLAEALNSQNPTGRLHSEAVGCMLSVGRKLKREFRFILYLGR
jgi:hypothetical protein